MSGLPGRQINLYKDDWDKCKERFEAFWEGELIDRCLIAVTAPRDRPIFPDMRPKKARDLKEYWTDPEFRFLNEMYRFSSTYYGGEAFPSHFNNLGPGVMAAFAGAGHTLAENTVWFDGRTVLKDRPEYSRLELDEKSEMWMVLTRMMDCFLKNCDSEFMTGITDLGGNFDIAAHFRSSENLLYDLVDYPEEVKVLIDEIDRVWLGWMRLGTLVMLKGK